MISERGTSIEGFRKIREEVDKKNLTLVPVWALFGVKSKQMICCKYNFKSRQLKI